MNTNENQQRTDARPSIQQQILLVAEQSLDHLPPGARDGGPEVYVMNPDGAGSGI